MTTEQHLNEYLEAGFDGMLQEIAGNDPQLLEAVKAASLPIIEAETSIDSINDSIERFNASSFGKESFPLVGNVFLNDVAWGGSNLRPDFELRLKHSPHRNADLKFISHAGLDVRNGILAVNDLVGAMRAQSELVKLLLQRLRDTKKELVRTQAAFDAMM